MLRLIATAVFASLFISSDSRAQPAEPDLILHHGKIVTVDRRFSICEAIAIRGERIVQAGSNAEVLARKGPRTRTVDLAGKMAMPGLIDCHTHPLSASLVEFDHPIPQMDSVQDVLNYFAARAKIVPAGQWLVLRQVFITRLREQRYPTRAELDAVAPGHPVVFATGPDAMLNTRALELNGIDRNFTVPGGGPGRVEKDPDTGEPTGLVRTFARFVKVPAVGRQPTLEDQERCLAELFRDYNAVGITAVCERDAYPDQIPVYQAYRQSGGATMRVALSHHVDSEGGLETVRENIRQVAGHPLFQNKDPMLRIIGIKTYLDGGMLTGSAYMRQPWGVSAMYGITDPAYRGVRFIPEERLRDMVRATAEAGLQFTAHSVGDGAVHALLDAYEEVSKELPLRRTRPCVSHSNFMSREAIDKAARLGVMLDIQPAWLYLDTRTLVKQFGYERLRYFQPLRSIFEAGVIAGGGSDHMQKLGSLRSNNPYNPFLAMATAVTRRARWYEGRLHPEEALSREQALRFYTINSAAIMFLDDDAGSLEPGKLADLIVLDRDLLTCPEEQLLGTQVLQTYFGGKLAYSALAQETASTNGQYWAIEDRQAREKLPLYQVIPAAKPEELTPANGFPKGKTFLTWERSHGDNGGMRYSALQQINRTNVTRLEAAWTYHSRDTSKALECNPIIVRDMMFTPTPGDSVAAVNAATGAELWRFKPEGRPAFRGLIYWPGRSGATERVMFCAGKFLYALDPKSGQPIADFGQGGKALLPGVAQPGFGAATAAPTIFQETIIVAGFEKDVWGFDVASGRLLWTFHTVPQPGEFGFETWDKPESYAANAWAGIALDEQRGIAFITTASPKPNFNGVRHRGQNLFANCVIALDARTGKRLWHFQEIRHDIWDLDVSAPPNLATITRDGRRIDVVAATTKIGNTLLLDRTSGKPIFPFRLRRAPASDVPGEQTWPYQPDPELPENFSKLEFTAADLTTRTDEAAEYARTVFKGMRTGWFLPCAEGRPTMYFDIDGGAEWTGACVDAETGRLYVTANHIGWAITLFRDDDPPDDPKAPKTPGQKIFETLCASCHGANRLGVGLYPPLRGLRHRSSQEAITKQIREGKNAMPAFAQLSAADMQALVDFLLLRDRPEPAAAARTERPLYSFAGYPRFYDQEGYPANKPPWGTINCIDLNTGKLVWKKPLGEYPQLAAEGRPATGTENYGGAIVTAGGLLFCSGTRDNKIRAFDKATGQELWAATLPWAGSAAPATYQIQGRQYVVIPATGVLHLGTPSGDAWVAFALPEDPASRAQR